MSDFERPAATPEAIVEAWANWSDGDELPGRTMADFKIAGLDLTLEVLGEDNEVASVLHADWMLWEKAKKTPGEALEAMMANGLEAYIEALAAAL